MRKAVFLDRDGVLNRVVVQDGRPYPPATLAQLELLPGVRNACASLREAGYLLVMITNQPDVGRGTQTREMVDHMNDWLKSELKLDDVRVCPHDDTERCGCRKPEPGMLTGAARDWDIDLSASFVVGDRWRDVEAGRRAGVRTVFIDCNYWEQRAQDPDRAVQSLAEAADWILSFAAASTKVNR